MNFEKVTANAVGNIYFEGKVISHGISLPSGEKKTLGVILPGSYHFGTEAPELMEIAEGRCSYVLDGESSEAQTVEAGSSFNVPGNSGFTITVKDAPCHYVCSFLDEKS